MRSSTSRPQFSWAFYDWANSAFSTTVMAGFFPLFFKQYWSSDLPVTSSTFYLGLGNSIASLIIMIAAPLLGAIADSGGLHKRLLVCFAFFGILATSSFFFIEQGLWPVALVVYVMAIIGFSGANVFYDAMLPIIAPKSQQHSLSALGFSLGYLGGGLLFAINVAMTLKPTWFGLTDAAQAVRWSFLSVAIWWALFTIPLLLYVKDPSDSESKKFTVASSLKKFTETVKRIVSDRNVAIFLLAYWFYIDGLATVIRMAVDYGLSIGLPANSLIIALLIVQFVSFPATLAFGRIGERNGAKFGLWIALTVYVVATFAAAFMQTSLHFYVLAVILGLVQGGVQSLSRSLFSHLIPAERSGEYFGFLNMLGKSAAFLGPLMVGVIGVLTGSTRFGIVSIVILFLIGMVLLKFVNEPTNAKAATA
ncbi:MAG: MFS transporter [Gammaproteobacteria bacterium]|nr:MFS transporter [Gammaproteobacteria bacterium]